MNGSGLSEVIYVVFPLGGRTLHAGSYTGAERRWFWRRPPRRTHELLLLDGGSARIAFPDETVEAREGDIVFIPAGEECSIEKLGREHMVLRFCQFDSPSRPPERTSLRELAAKKARSNPSAPPASASPSGTEAEAVLIPRFFRHPPQPERLGLFLQMEDIEAEGNAACRVEMFRRFLALLASIHRCVQSAVDYAASADRPTPQTAAPTPSESGEARHVPRALHFITTHLQDPITPSDVADALELHPDYLGRIFRRRMGVTLGRYILSAKMDVARARLMADNRTVKQVAAGLGFSDPRYFSRRFKELVGEPPSAYLRRRSEPVPPPRED